MKVVNFRLQSLKAASEHPVLSEENMFFNWSFYASVLIVFVGIGFMILPFFSKKFDNKGEIQAGNYKANLPIPVLLIVLGGAGLYFTEYFHDKRLVENLQMKLEIAEDQAASRLERGKELQENVSIQNQTIEELKLALEEIRMKLNSAVFENEKLSYQLSHNSYSVDEIQELEEGYQKKIEENRDIIQSLKEDLRRQSEKIEQAERLAQEGWLIADTLSLSSSERKELERVKQGVDELNKELTHIGIRRAYWPVFEGDKPSAIFEIYSKKFAKGDLNPNVYSPMGVGLFNFYPKRIEIDGVVDGYLDLSDGSEIYKALCEGTKRAISENVSISEVLSYLDGIKNIPKDGVNALELIGTLQEFQYVQERLKFLLADVIFVVRGHAENEGGDWREVLEEGLVNAEIYLKNNNVSDQLRKNLEFDSFPTNIDIGEIGEGNIAYFEPRDLPNLRGVFSAKLIEDIVHSCRSNNVTDRSISMQVRVVEGIFDDRKYNFGRRSRVYFLVYLQ